MHMHTCTCTYMHAHVCICAHAQARRQTISRVDMKIARKRMCTHIWLGRHPCAQARTCAHTCACEHTSACTCTSIRAHLYTGDIRTNRPSAVLRPKRDAKGYADSWGRWQALTLGRCFAVPAQMRVCNDDGMCILMHDHLRILARVPKHAWSMDLCSLYVHAGTRVNAFIG